MDPAPLLPQQPDTRLPHIHAVLLARYGKPSPAHAARLTCPASGSTIFAIPRLREVQEILGHRTFAMTIRYSHLSTAHERAAVDRLDGLTPAAESAPKAETLAQEMAQGARIGPERAVSP